MVAGAGGGRAGSVEGEQALAETRARLGVGAAVALAAGLRELVVLMAKRQADVVGRRHDSSRAARASDTSGVSPPSGKPANAPSINPRASSVRPRPRHSRARLRADRNS